LTRQLLAFGRKQTLQPVLVNINDVVSGMERLLQSTLGSYCRVTLTLNPFPLCAFIDVAQLECAILNLVINARDAMPNGGVVTIKTASVDHAADYVGKFVLLAINDTGTGMSESVSQQAFDPFFTTKQIGEGSGLGLSQVYGLVQQSGGVTEIDSHLGRGTTINIYLPQHDIHVA
jgi:signal transduction histidine kinase